MTSVPLLEVRDLTVELPVRGRRRDVLRAVDRVSFELARGGALGLVGESGSGKSTVARALVGLQRPTSGTVRFDGLDLARSPRARRRIGLVFQDPYGSLDPRQLAGDAVVEPLAIARRDKPRTRRLKALAALDACGLEPRTFLRYPHELSGGQRQRVAIARALVVEPDLLVCDEPTSALDVSVRAQVLELLRDLRRRFGLAILAISHDLAVVRHLCDDVAVLYLGRVVENGPAAELFRTPFHPYTRALLAAVPVADPGARRPPATARGEPPSPLRPPPGCPFHPRCPERDAVPGRRCSTEVPVLPEAKNAGRSLRAACHLPRCSPAGPTPPGVAVP
jgi:oligopeptide/dipeptide ABC transporter ATP-binding protein